MLEPVCLSFPCPLHGLAAPVRLEHGFAGGEHEGALGREGTISATSPVVVVPQVVVLVFFPRQKVISFWEACSLPQLAPEMQCCDIFSRYDANKCYSQTLPLLSPLFGVQVHCLPHWEWPSHLVNRWWRRVLESAAAMWLVVTILRTALRKRTLQLGLGPVFKLDQRRESCSHLVGCLWLVASGVLGSVV